MGLIQREDGYVNATEMCRQTGKLLSEYFRSKNTKTYIECLSNRIGLSKEEIVFFGKRGRGGTKDTWIHPAVALDLARWIGTETAVDANLWICEQVKKLGFEIQVQRKALVASTEISDRLQLVEAIHQFKRINNKDMRAKNHANDLLDVIDRHEIDWGLVAQAFSLLERAVEVANKTKVAAEEYDAWHQYEAQLVDVFGGAAK